jgi:hypothetical protein
MSAGRGESCRPNQATSERHGTSLRSGFDFQDRAESGVLGPAREKSCRSRHSRGAWSDEGRPGLLSGGGPHRPFAGPSRVGSRALAGLCGGDANTKLFICLQHSRTKPFIMLKLLPHDVDFC